MPRINYGNILVIYFVIGAVMLGGGAFEFQNVPVLNMVFANSNLDLASSVGGQFDLMYALGPVLAILMAVVQFITNMIQFIHWPVTVFWEAGTPLSLTVLLGGSLTLMFYISAVNWLRGIA